MKILATLFTCRKPPGYLIHPTSRVMPINGRQAACIGIFIVSFVILLATVSDYGFTWDEPFYIAHSNRLQRWFGLFFNGESPFSEDAVSSLLQFDRYHNCHPPFYKLSAIVFKNFLGKYLYSNILYQYRVSTAFWSALLISLIFCYLHRVYQSYWIAFLGAGLFLTVPRFFAHMHLFATDAIIVSLWFSAVYLFVFGEKTVSTICGGLFGGALLATKFTGILLFPVLLFLAACFDKPKEYAQRLAIFIPASALGFILFDIHLWAGFRQELLFYFRSVLDRSSVAPIATLFFGKVYDFHLPWYHPLIMLGICIPFSLVVFVVMSPLFGRYRQFRKHWLFELPPLIFLLFVFALPATPKHDGIRLFSLAWPYLILLSIRGFCGLSHILCDKIIKPITSLRPQTADKVKWGLAIVPISVTLMVNVVALIQYHPLQLSYYNTAIGGSMGAAKKGFTISYWYEALDQNFLEKLNALARHEPLTICSIPNPDILEYNKVLGLVNRQVESVTNPGDADYLLVLNRIIRPRMSDFLQRKETAVAVTTPDNVWVISLFDNNNIARQKSSYSR